MGARPLSRICRTASPLRASAAISLAGRGATIGQRDPMAVVGSNDLKTREDQACFADDDAGTVGRCDEIGGGRIERFGPAAEVAERIGAGCKDLQLGITAADPPDGDDGILGGRDGIDDRFFDGDRCGAWFDGLGKGRSS